jgi:5'-nucleotidase
MLRLTLDMDDVLADTHGRLVEIILNDFSTTLDEKDLHSKALRELLHPKQLSKLHKIIDTPGFFADIKVKEGAEDTVYTVVAILRAVCRHSLHGVSQFFQGQVHWLRKYFPFIPWTNIVFCGYKSIIQSDYLIDDHVRNLVAFKGKGILIFRST